MKKFVYLPLFLLVMPIFNAQAQEIVKPPEASPLGGSWDMVLHVN
jgi:hypothetical protein